MPYHQSLEDIRGLALTQGSVNKKIKTIGERWIDAAKSSGFSDENLIIDTLGTELTNIRALTGSIILASHIQKISPEQNIATLLPTSAHTMLCNMAVMLLGKTLLNLNYTASTDSIKSSIQQADVKTIYTSSRFLQKLEARGIDTSWLDACANIVVLEKLGKQTSFLQKFSTLMRCKLSSAESLKKRYLTKTDPESPAVILFSSGSENAPKGVVLSHRNILTNVDQLIEILKVQEQDVILANLPLFHAFGLTATVFMPLIEGIKVVCHPDPTDAVATANAIAKHQATIMLGTSTFFRLYIKNTRIKAETLASLRLVVAGAEKLQEEVREEFLKKFNHSILEGYGATELSPVACVNRPDEVDENGQTLIYTKIGSVGLPIPHTEILIVDPESQSPLPTGESGMILISGEQVMLGYLNDPEKSAKVLPKINGKTWYVSGDKGYLDSDGFLFIQDRYSRFAKIGGEMVGLGKVEAAIHKVIDDIELELVAVNMPDKKKGETIIVLANRSLDPKELRNKLLGHGLQSLSLPSAYFLVDEIPTLGSGKTDFGTAKKLALRVRDVAQKYEKK